MVVQRAHRLRTGKEGLIQQERQCKKDNMYVFCLVFTVF